MLAEVAGGPCVSTGVGRHTLYGLQKLKGQKSTINASRPLILQKKKRKEKEEEEEDLRQFSRKILFLFSLISLPNTSKHLDSSLFSTITRQKSCTQSSSPWFHTLDLRFRGMDVAFQLQSTPFSFCSFFLFNNMLYCFSQYVLALFFFLACFLAFCHDLSL